MIRRPPRSTLFPSPPLFRSERDDPAGGRDAVGPAGVAGDARYDLVDDPRLVGAVPPGALLDRQVPRGPRTGVVGVDAVELHPRSEEHTSELQSQSNLVCRLL